MAIEDVLTRMSVIQARFGTTLHGSALFHGVASDAARHAGLGRDETPVLDPTGADDATTDAAAVAGLGSAVGLAAAVSGESVDDGVAAQLSAAAAGGSSTLLDLAAAASGADAAGGGALELLAGLIAEQQARAGLDGTGR